MTDASRTLHAVRLYFSEIRQNRKAGAELPEGDLFLAWLGEAGFTVEPIRKTNRNAPFSNRDAAIEAAAAWLASDDTAYEQSPSDARRVAAEMIKAASAAYAGQPEAADPDGRWDAICTQARARHADDWR
ncbi:MAG: hypothetical protein WCI96_14270 [Planctomycetota bacterium]